MKMNKLTILLLILSIVFELNNAENRRNTHRIRLLNMNQGNQQQLSNNSPMQSPSSSGSSQSFGFPMQPPSMPGSGQSFGFPMQPPSMPGSGQSFGFPMQPPSSPVSGQSFGFPMQPPQMSQFQQSQQSLASLNLPPHLLQSLQSFSTTKRQQDPSIPSNLKMDQSFARTSANSPQPFKSDDSEYDVFPQHQITKSPLPFQSQQPQQQQSAHVSTEMPPLKNIQPQQPQQQSSYSSFIQQPQLMQQPSQIQGYNQPAQLPQQSYGNPSTNILQNDQTVINNPIMIQVDSCSSNPCLNEGICLSTGQSKYSCKCPWGWTGLNCEICLTECASNPCPSNKKCKAKFGGGYECICPNDKAGINCEIQNDICSINSCLNGGICKPVDSSSFTCDCSKPWSGPNCERVWENPCTEDVLRSPNVKQFKDPWDRRSYIICINIHKYHSMPCSIGTYFNENLHHCVPEGYEPPVCPAEYCQNEGECLVDEKNLLKCVCRKGFSGDRCETNIDECLIEGNAACAGGKCIDQVNGYYCECQNNTIGLNCLLTAPNPCTISNLDDGNHYFDMPSLRLNSYIQCTGEGHFQVHKCADNLFWHQEEQTCTVERPLLRSSLCSALPCKNGGKCQVAEDGSNEVKCVCKVGYKGPNCEEMIDFCESNPCRNEGKCLSYSGGYTCVCPDKVIDECCCNGVINPCPPKSSLVPGVNNYYSHLFPHRYIHCDFDGRAFVRTCAHGTRWHQDLLSCLPDSMNPSMFQQNQTMPFPTKERQIERLPILQQTQQSSYGAQQPMMDLPILKIEQPAQSYGSINNPSQYGSITNQPIQPLQQQQPELPKPTQQAYNQPSQILQQEQPQSYASQQQINEMPAIKNSQQFGSFNQPSQQIPQQQISPQQQSKTFTNAQQSFMTPFGSSRSNPVLMQQPLSQTLMQQLPKALLESLLNPVPKMESGKPLHYRYRSYEK